jgi:hypothetical protein
MASPNAEVRSLVEEKMNVAEHDIVSESKWR